MRGHRSFRVLAVAAALLVLATACASTQPAGGSPTTGPVKGGTLVFAIWQEPATLAPNYGNQTITGIVNAVAVEGLLRTDTGGNYQPVLAKAVPTEKNGGVKISGDGKRMDVTYELQPDIKWSDGRPFTSADVKFTWEAWMKDPKVVSREGYEQIESIDTPNDLTVLVHYKTIYSPYLTRFGTIMPKHILEKVADISASDYGRKPLGTGPFVITDFKAGDSITVERNPNYRKKGQPYLDKIIFRSVPSREVAVAQLKAGEVQGMWNLIEAQLPDLEKDANIKLSITPAPGVERIEMNTAVNKDGTDPNSVHPVLGDINLRRALIYATPKQQIIDRLLFGKARVGSSPVSQGWAAPKGLTQESYDPKKSNELLDQAGWVKGGDGIRTKNGVRASVTITTTTGDQLRERVEQILADEYKQIGVELKISNMPSSVLLSASWSAGDPRKRGAFDLDMYSSTPDIDPHQTVNLRYHSKQIPYPGNGGSGQNYTRFKNPEADKAIDEAGSALDLEKRAAAYAKALTLLNDAAVCIWLYERSAIEAFRTNVSGYAGQVWDGITWNTEDWYMKGTAPSY